MHRSTLVAALHVTLLTALLPCGAASAQSESRTWRFDFGAGPVAEGCVAVTPDTLYSAEVGYGLEPGAAVESVDHDASDPLTRDSLTSSALIEFSVAVPEGAYRVTVTLGDAETPAVTTVKAETRRLMAEHVLTEPGEFVTRAFTIDTRNRSLPNGQEVKLDSREANPETGEILMRHWDDRLTLQFSDDHPAVCAVEVAPVDDVITVFLMGDSTVHDQVREPYGTWGQMLPRWFGPGVAIANHAESGETLKSFRALRRWDKVLSQLEPGDYVLMQFGHNDLNSRGENAMWRGQPEGEWANTHSPANTDYKQHLKEYAAAIAERGATPVIVSPMTKINIRTGEINTQGLGDYPAAAMAAAAEAGVASIDLNAMSIAICESLGPENSIAAYVDGLHTNSYGGYLLSRCIVAGIKSSGFDLADHLVDDAGDFDIAHPHPLPSEFDVPLEPRPQRGRRGGIGRGRPGGGEDAPRG